MDDILSSIISIEKRAQEMVNEAHLQGEEILKKAGGTCGDISADITKRQELRISKVDEMERKVAEEEIDKIRLQYEDKHDLLQNLYKSRKQQYIDEIFNNIIGR